jgi:hypothetical protein
VEQPGRDSVAACEGGHRLSAAGTEFAGGEAAFRLINAESATPCHVADLRGQRLITHDGGMRAVRCAATRLVLCALLILPRAVGAQGAAPEIRFDVAREGEFINISASVDLPVKQALAWRVIVDYEAYPRFASSISQNRIIARTPQGLVLDQKGEVSFLFFSQPIEARMLVVEYPMHTVVARVIDGNLGEMAARYELQPSAEGVRLTYSARLVSAIALPPLIGLTVVRYLLHKRFAELAQEILRRERSAPAG